METTKLTTQSYWENYYSLSNVNKDAVVRVCSVYDRFWQKLISHNRLEHPDTIIEIGGYPGRYLAYLASTYKLTPTSLDFNSDREKINETMAAFRIDKFHVIQTDFLKHQPTEQFDIVISNGFIEHFANFNEVMDKHVAYLKEGGTMLIMIPNKRWLRKWYGMLVDHKNLKAHNLKSMRKKVFTDFADRNGLELLEFTYFGGFAYSPHQSLNTIQKIIYKSFSLVFKKLNPFIARHPNAFFSSSIVACFKK